MKRETVETLLWLFCIVVVVSLGAKIKYEAVGYDCDECSVVLSVKMAHEEQYRESGDVKIKELWEPFAENNECKLGWSPTQGFIGG